MSTRKCGRCGDTYNSYKYIVRDDTSELLEEATATYDRLCKPCRAAVHPGQAFVGAADVTPKEVIDISLSFEAGFLSRMGIKI